MSHVRNGTFIDFPELAVDAENDELLFDKVADKVLRSLMPQLTSKEQIEFLEAVKRVLPHMLEQVRSAKTQT